MYYFVHVSQDSHYKLTRNLEVYMQHPLGGQQTKLD